MEVTVIEPKKEEKISEEEKHKRMAILLRKCLAEADRGLVVLFVKKDGTQRNIRCTTKEDLIPKSKRPKNEKPRAHNNELNIPVFDLDKKDWRSFNVDTVESVTAL